MPHDQLGWTRQEALALRKVFKGDVVGQNDANMIDVRFVIAHALWILGAAVAVAAFSYYHWLAGERHMRLREMFAAAWGWKCSNAIAMLLIASGFLLMEGTSLWQGGAWLAVWTGAVVDLWRLRHAA